MDPLMALTISQMAGKLFSGIGGALFGGESPRIPPYMEQMLLKAYNDRNMTGFLPNKGAYDESLRADIDEIMAGLPVGSEAFESDLASRGIRGSGEAVGAKYRDVYAPIARAATSAAAQSNLGYAQAYQSGSIAAENLRQNTLQMLMQMHQFNTGLDYQDYIADQAGIGDMFGGIGNAAGLLSSPEIMKLLGMENFSLMGE